MGTELFDGRKLAEDIVSTLSFSEDKPHMVIIVVGEDERSQTFVELKDKCLKRTGALSTVVHLPENTSEAELIQTVQKFNVDVNVNGILVQLPLPEQIDEARVLQSVLPEKDVDGLTPENLGRLVLGMRGLVPCTVKAILRLLEPVELQGKHVVIISRSSLIGKPLALKLLEKDATVTVCHSKTRDLAEHTRRADVVVSAVGLPHFLTGDMVKENAVVIDAGYAVLGKRVAGDVDGSVRGKVLKLAAVPGGVGPLTVAMVASNLFEAFGLQQNRTGRIRVVWLSANLFGFEMLREAVSLPCLDVVGLVTLSEKSSTIMYDGIERVRWYELGVPVYPVERVNDSVDLLRKLAPDLIVEAGWRQIICNEILTIPRLGTVGFHPTLLPHGRGSAPIINTILEGLEESGETLFYLSDKVDCGDIIGQSMFKISSSDYASDVYGKVVEAGRVLVRKYLPLLATGKAQRQVQDEVRSSTFPKRSLKENRIDLATETPLMVLRKVRALGKPYRGAYIQLDGCRLIVWKAELIGDEKHG